MKQALLPRPISLRSSTPPRTLQLPKLPGSTLAAGAVLALVVLASLFPNALAPYLSSDMDSGAILLAPDAVHWFGTDQFGRDVFSSVIYGARQSLLIGVLATVIGGSLGTAIGISAGFLGGWFDLLLMRFVDVWLAIPNILLAIALCTALGPSFPVIILAVSLSSVPRFARVLRARALAIRARPFVLAARAAGASRWEILRGHIVPHCIPPILVMATLGIGTSILIGSALSFLGLGVNDERPDWGYLLTQGRGYLTVAWWSVTFPGLAISALLISVNMLGDALRQRLDPRAKAEP